MRTLHRLVAALTLAALLAVHSARGQETDEEENAETLEELEKEETLEELYETGSGDDELDIPVMQETPDSSPEMHMKGEECMRLIEQIERDIGLFDDHSLTPSKREALIQAVQKNSAEIFGGKSETFNENIERTLRGVWSAQNSYGAADVCRLILNHHDQEL